MGPEPLDPYLLSNTSDAGLRPTEAIEPEESASVMIGRYRLLQKIGQGGMGEVWLAEQKEPVRRRVALKLIRADMSSRELILRFESERQTLALMDHPAIAKVFDAGSTPQGTPYFVMEYVPGVPITVYCDNHRLSTRERLELFVHVCEGVQHAHQKAIIHRDLKPSNILVTEVDGRAAPQIIDFGIAKALTQKLNAEVSFTRLGTPIGTPEYMSPEQANPTGEDIDTRTDVYSLGIILYELLAGAPPIELGGITYEEFLRRLREQEPLKPSTRIRSHDPVSSTDMARKRQARPLELAKLMRGDLDSIAMKALEKERSRRYGSPSDLAADIVRYLNNEPVLAVPPSAAYRARKFAGRHGGALVTATAFVLVLILSAVISVGQSIRATRQRDRADAEAAKAEAVSDFLRNDLLAQASAAKQSEPNVKPDPEIKVRTALDRAAVRLTGKFDKQPEVEAAIRGTIGQTYIGLGLLDQARTQLERALEILRRVAGEQDPKTLNAMGRLAKLSHDQGRYAQAEDLFRRSIEIQRRVRGPEHPETLNSMHGLATVYSSQGKFKQAEDLHGKVLEIQRRVLGPDHTDTLATLNDLAIDYAREGNLTKAEPLFRQTMEGRRRVLGEEHPETLTAIVNLATLYNMQGKYAQAEPFYSEASQIQRRLLGPEHPDTLRSMNNLAFALNRAGKYAQAEALAGQTLEIERRLLGPEHPDTLITMTVLAGARQFLGNYPGAEAVLLQTLEIRRRVLGPEHPAVLDVLSDLASLYQRQGRYAQAESYAAQTLTGRRRVLGMQSPSTMGTAADLALAELSQGKAVESEALAREDLDFERANRPDDWQRFRAASLLGASLAGQKKYAEAEPLLVEGYEGMLARKDRMAVPNWYHLERAKNWTVQLYQGWGKPDKAAEWKKK